MRVPRGVPAAPLPADEAAARAVEAAAAGKDPTVLLEASRAARPQDAILAYHLARARQRAGASAASLPLLREALAVETALPRTLAGWAMIRLGDALKESGVKAEPAEWYRRASALKGFPFGRAAEDRLRNPGADLPLGG